MPRPVRARFTNSVWILQDVHVYLLPDNRLAFRSTTCQRHHRLPQGALLLGRYAYPSRTDDFLADLAAALATLRGRLDAR